VLNDSKFGATSEVYSLWMCHRMLQQTALMVGHQAGGNLIMAYNAIQHLVGILTLLAWQSEA
jgi:hypothetical protein